MEKNVGLKVIDGGKKNKKSDNRNEPKEWEKSDEFPGSEAIKERLFEQVHRLVAWLLGQAGQKRKFFEVENGLIPIVFRLACLGVMLYLARREEILSKDLPDRVYRYGRWFKKKGRQRRTIKMFFGGVTYWRTYYYSEGKAGKRGNAGKGMGFHPLDQELSLTSDGFSLHVVSLAGRLAAMMPFACAAQLMKLFMGGAPSVTTVEHMVLGLGAHTQAYFDQALSPLGDGEVLVIMIDGKAIPTATERELRKRRGKRKKQNNAAGSARHRGRSKRKGWQQKKRRRKGEKKKNGRSGTVVVMYTLKLSPDGKLLLGPINKKVYASFAPKRVAFQYARQQAEKRGFEPGSNKLIQFVSDGDEDFRVYLKDYFGEYGKNELKLTLDLMHVMEYIWKAGGPHFGEGSEELSEWAHQQKTRLLESRADLVLAELKRLFKETPKFGPGNKNRREKTQAAIKYIKDNLDRMDYQYYCEADLELATGAVEGAVNHVIGIRLDNGGMRWIVERAEAVLQLRCIMLNGDWDDFVSYVQQQFYDKYEESPSVQILRKEPVGLPVLKAVA